MVSNPYETYKQQSVMTMTPGQMLITVYNELIKQMQFTLISFEKNDLAGINNYLIKAQQALGLLRGALNSEYGISNDLDALYEYFNHVLVNTNIKKDASELPAVIDMVTELRDAFAEADKKAQVS